MVRIGPMASRIFPIDRREFLAGLGAAALVAGFPRSASTAGPVAVPLRAKAGFLALRPGQPETPSRSLGGPRQPLRFRCGSRLEMALQNALDRPVVGEWRGLNGIPSA